MSKLFHVSERGNIEKFIPRPIPSPDTGITGEAVWAIDKTRLPNYLLPRDCPRVTFCCSEMTSEEDRKRFNLNESIDRVIAIEAGWKSIIENSHIYLYEFASDTFQLVDDAAGYYISRCPVTPTNVRTISNLLKEINLYNVELRILPNLWALRNAIVKSTMQYSIVKFKNASPAE